MKTIIYGKFPIPIQPFDELSFLRNKKKYEGIPLKLY